MTDNASMVCYRHPNTETTLRCSRCEKPICPKCARRTPTGYRCPDCIKQQQRVFVTAEWYDYLSGFVTAAVLAGIGMGLLNLIGSGFGIFFYFIMFAVATGLGALIAEAVRRVTGKRRAKSLFITATAGVVVGGVIPIIPTLVFFFLTGEFYSLISLLWPAIALFVTASTTYVRLSGIQLGR